MKKKLVYIANYVHRNDAQHFFHIMALLNALEQHCAWEVTLLSEKGGSGVDTVEGKQVHYLSQTSKVLRVVRLCTRLLKLRVAGYRLVFVRISRPAAIVSSLVGRLIGMQVLYWQSGAVNDWNQAQPLRTRFLDRLTLEATIRLIHRFVTGPESMLDYYRRELRVPDRKLMLLYNDVDLRRFRPARSRKDDPQTLNVLCVHRFSRLRETTLYLPAILEALVQQSRAGRKTTLVLIGEGEEVGALKEIVRTAGNGLEVQFLGAIPNSQIQQHYARADIFIMPSYREGFPRVMIEAMAMGLASVATDAGGTRDIVGPLQQQWIVPRDDPGAFGARLAALARDEDARERVAAENLEYVKRYSTPAVALMYDRAMAGLL